MMLMTIIFGGDMMMMTEMMVLVAKGKARRPSPPDKNSGEQCYATVAVSLRFRFNLQKSDLVWVDSVKPSQLIQRRSTEVNLGQTWFGFRSGSKSQKLSSKSDFGSVNTRVSIMVQIRSNGLGSKDGQTWSTVNERPDAR
ncbi:hypothetical protein Hdeb2414_s0007g00245401 [Helianthus debilis subsp. tardiflorus]